MADVRRSAPKLPWGGPQVVHTPGIADDLMREITLQLAEDGTDLDDPASIPTRRGRSGRSTARSSGATSPRSRRSGKLASSR